MLTFNDIPYQTGLAENVHFSVDYYMIHGANGTVLLYILIESVNVVFAV